MLPIELRHDQNMLESANKSFKGFLKRCFIEVDVLFFLAALHSYLYGSLKNLLRNPSTGSVNFFNHSVPRI